MPAAPALLIVDDNEDNRYTLTRRLTREGYGNLTTAVDGRQALEFLRKQKFDLLLLDIMMPELNGYQVLEHLKADPWLRDVPVIMISAVEEMDSVVRCIELGAEDYLPKPFNSTLLRARIGASLEKKALRDAVRSSLDRLERELDAARVLQLGMLPTTFPTWSADRPVEVYALVDPAREVGGDLYDFFYAGDGMFCFLVGDVCGKGAPAAMFMARTRSLVRMATGLWRNLGARSGTPAEIASAVNRELCLDNHDCMFVTLFLGMLDTRSGALSYVNAGHPLPHLLRASGAIERIDGKPEVPLGVSQDFEYRSRSAEIRPGDAVFVCTDGVAEAMNEEEAFYTDGRLVTDLQAAVSVPPAGLVRAVKERVDAFTGAAPKADDVAMLALRWTPAPRQDPETRAPTVAAGTSPPPPSGSKQQRLPIATSLTIRNDLNELTLLSEAMRRIGAERRISPKPLMQLQVALDEVVSNVIRYAWPDGGVHDIHIHITVQGDEVKIEIVDDGVTFNPLDAPPPPRTQHGGGRRSGGVGIHMTKQLVDTITFERVGSCNHLTMIKRHAIDVAPQ